MGGLARGLRVGRRLAAMAAVTAVAALPVLACAGVLARRPRARARAGAWITHLWARCFLPCMGVRLVRRGPLPPPGAMVVANHLSYLDIPVLAACCPTLFLSKAEIARWPVIGTLARAAGTLFIDRTERRDTGRVFAQLSVWLRAGERITWFPESTTSRGDRVHPFKPSLFQAALRAGAPCCPVTLQPAVVGAAAAASERVCWHGPVSLASHALRLLALPRVVYTVTFHPPVAGATDRKALARACEEQVAAAFTPVV